MIDVNLAYLVVGLIMFFVGSAAFQNKDDE